MEPLGLIGNYDDLSLAPGMADWLSQTKGLEIIPTKSILIKKPKYWLADYIKNGKFYWYPDIKMMRNICRKTKQSSLIRLC